MSCSVTPGPGLSLQPSVRTWPDRAPRSPWEPSSLAWPDHAAPDIPYCRGWFRINRVSAEHTRRWGSRHRSRWAPRLREIAEDRHRPVELRTRTSSPTSCALISTSAGHSGGPAPCRLDRSAHGGPDGRHRMPLAVVLRGVNAKTVKGQRLVAQDLDRTHGEGFNVYGSAEALLLAAIRARLRAGADAPYVSRSMHPALSYQHATNAGDRSIADAMSALVESGRAERLGRGDKVTGRHLG